MDADDNLLAVLRARIADPATRVDVGGPVPPVYEPATPEAIAVSEALLGFPLHPFLRRVYGEVANGGFGPGYGMAGLAGGHGDAEGESLPQQYREFRSGEWPDGREWPERLLPLWDWGDAIWSCVDASSREGTIVTHDDVDGATVTDFTIRSWLGAWVDGVNLWNEIYEDGGREMIGINPFTREPMIMKAPGRARGRKYERS